MPDAEFPWVPDATPSSPQLVERFTDKRPDHQMELEGEGGFQIGAF